MSHSTRFSDMYADRQAFTGFTFCLKVFKSKVRNQEPKHLPRRHPHPVRVDRELISRVNLMPLLIVVTSCMTVCGLKTMCRVSKTCVA